MASPFANRLNLLLERHHNGMGTAALGRAINVSKSAVSKWRHGERSPDPDTVGRICGALDVSADYILGLTDDPAPRRELDTDEQRPGRIRRRTTDRGDAIAVLKAIADLIRTADIEALEDAVASLTPRGNNHSERREP